MRTTTHPPLVINGRSYPLFKRNSKLDSPWCVRVQSKGIRRTLSTGTADHTQALDRARLIVESALAGDWHTIDTLRQPRRKPDLWPTVAQILKASEQLPSKAAHLYRQDLIKLIATATSQPETNVLALTLDVLTPPLARAFQAAMQSLPKVNPDHPTPKNATANSILKNARCLFSRKALALYDRLNLPIPDLKPFLTVPLLTTESERYSDNPIPDATLQEIDTALPSLPAAIRKAHYAIRLHGKPPGQIPTATAHKHATFLRRWNLTPSHLWHHAAASMLQRTGSLDTTAKWAGMSITAAKWHLGKMVKEPESLRVEETYLGF
jgi:hypothetical protein